MAGLERGRVFDEGLFANCRRSRGLRANYLGMDGLHKERVSEVGWLLGVGGLASRNFSSVCFSTSSC
jgi:hypothetical protein